MLPNCKTLFLICKPRTDLFCILVRVFDLGGKQTQSIGAVRLERTDKAHGQKAELQTRGGIMLRFRSGEVTVNGEVELRRGKKIVIGDRVAFDGEDISVEG